LTDAVFVTRQLSTEDLPRAEVLPPRTEFAWYGLRCARTCSGVLSLTRRAISSRYLCGCEQRRSQFVLCPEFQGSSFSAVGARDKL